MSDKISQPPGVTTALYILTAVTGLVDAVAFLALGHVFTANMTGNIAFLGFAAAGIGGLSIPRSLSALGGFLLGALAGGCIATSLSSSIRRCAITAFAVEATLLLAATIASLGSRSTMTSESALYIVIVMTALAMGIRNATVRKLAVADLTTTVLTLTTTGLAADSSFAGGNNVRWQRRTLSVALMFAGAAIGAWLLKRSVALPLAVATFLSVCAIATLFTNVKTIARQTLSEQSRARQL